MSSAFHRAALAASLLCAALSGCDACSAPSLAELVSAEGTVTADLAAPGVEWTPASVGRRFVIDEAVHTEADAAADLSLSGGAHLHLDPDTIVRFERPHEEGHVSLEVEMGSTVVEASSDSALEIETAFGVARLDAHSSARIGADDGRLEVIVGHATVEREDAPEIELTGGISIDGAGDIVRPEVTEPAVAPDAGQPPRETPDAFIVPGGDPAIDPALEPVSSVPPPHVDDGRGADGRGHDGPYAVQVQAGGSDVVHDPGAPTRVRFQPPADCGEATWSIAGSRAHSLAAAGPLVLELAAGSHAHEVRCASGLVSRGTLRIDRDAGRAAMPHSAPRTVVDADGRPYSVLYQSLLPEILFRWPHPPGAGPFTVQVVSPGRSPRTLQTSAPSVVLASGDLAEGNHTLTFHGPAGAESPPTIVRIRFDNATPMATIRTPTPGAPLAPVVHVEATVEDGGSVSINGAPFALDASSRLAADVPLSSAGCLDIRVVVGGRTPQHYVRCGSR